MTDQPKTPPERFGVWFHDGEWRYGWLDGRLGYRWEGTYEAAVQKRHYMELHDREGFCFVVLSLDTSDQDGCSAIKALRERARAKQRARWA
jgi:hypothetical protein